MPRGAAVATANKPAPGRGRQSSANRLAEQKQIDGVLTKEQREQLSSGGYGAWCY